ncbi:unnamed protein product [Caenorhabditis auriculariae]|uniref:Uncharacterized protein n=1 Tax=Caenorhabditis auriculariae TaxID=2777116 RepID=A0A8S1HPW3_9PELO|nr:unnamed protein product [Caenorhabditis auriculariae]
MCGPRPASDVKVKLWDEDDGPDPDDVLDEGVTDADGFFQLSGSEREMTTSIRFSRFTTTATTESSLKDLAGLSAQLMGGDVKFKDRSPLLQSYDSRSLGLAWNRRSMSISCSLINLRLRQMAMMVLTIFGLFSSIYVIYLLYFSYMDYVEKLAIDEVLPPQKWDFEESPHLKSTEVEANFIEWQKDYFNRSVNPHLRCGEFFDDYNNETRKSYVEAGRMTLPEEKLNFSMDCNSIRRRIFGNTFFTKSDRPLAYSRLVYRSYALQEALLSMSYHPDDWYCYAIDQKASCRFKSEMKVLGACLDNVIVLDEEFDLNSSGRDYNRGGLACFEKLRAKDWFHVMSLQNNDMIVKTHEEMVAVSKFLNISSNTGSEPPKRERRGASMNILISLKFT